MSKLLIIVGPTASGKSSLAIDLAQKYNGEIISGDSVAVYKELNIGSAKVKSQEQKGIVHHLLDYKEVTENYDVATFQKEAREKIEAIQKKGKLPIVVGGTGLYIKALLYDYNFSNTIIQNNDYSQYDNQQLYDLLIQKDPESAKIIHPNNRKRVMRALDICSNGLKKSEIEQQQSHLPIYDHFLIGLTMDKEKLKERINDRVDTMMKDGLLQEVSDLYQKYNFNYHCFSAIGYKEFVPYFKKEKTLTEVVEDIKTHTRQFAKRQYTWFNNQMNVKWFDVLEADFHQQIISEVEKYLYG